MGKIQQVVTTDKKKKSTKQYLQDLWYQYFSWSQNMSLLEKQKAKKKNNVELKYWIRSDEIKIQIWNN